MPCGPVVPEGDGAGLQFETVDAFRALGMGDELVEEFATFVLGQALDPYRAIRVPIQPLVATAGMPDDPLVPHILRRVLRVS